MTDGDARVPPQLWFNDLDHENRIRTRMTTDARGRVITFMLQFEVLVNEEWLPVVRYDSSHGQAHVDYINLRGVTYEKVWLGHWAPFNDAFSRAEDELKATWPTHRARFLKQMKGA